MVYLTVLYFIFTIIPTAKSEDERLQTIFPGDYDKYQPPWTEDNPAHVYLQLSVMDVDKIDDGALEYSLRSYIAEMWKDHRLNLSGFQTKLDKYFNFPTNFVQYIWVPDLVFDNTKNGKVFHLAQENRVIRLLSDGTFRRTSRYNLLVGCKMNFHLYPIDTQKCFLKIGSMANSDFKMSLHWAEELKPKSKQSIVFTDDIQPLKYIIGKPNSYKHTEIWTSGNYTYLYANFTFVRRVSGNIFNTYIPSTLVVFLSWISFWLDIEAVPARVTLGVTSLLTLATQMVQARSELPRISYMTAMDVWLFLCLITVFCSLIEFAISYHFHLSEKQQSFLSQTAKVASIFQKEEMHISRSRMRHNVTSKTASFRESSGKSVKSSSVKKKGTALDSFSQKIFPFGFFMSATIYWIYYLHAKKQ